MAGSVKKLQFSEGTDVGAPTDLSLQTSTSVISAYADDAAFVTDNGPAADGSVYLNSTLGKFRYFLTAWRNAVPESDLADPTKTFLINNTGSGTGTSATLLFTNTSNRVFTFPNFSGTMATLAGTEALSNKAISASTLNAVTITNGVLDVTAAGALAIAGSLGANNLTLAGSSSTVVIPGDLLVQGTTVTVNTDTLEVEDPNILLNRGGLDATAEGAGLTIQRTTTNGSLVFQNSLASKWKLGLIGAEVEIVDVSTGQTITNKLLGASNRFTNESVFTAITTPSNPTAGQLKFYPKADGYFYSLNSSGVETQIGAGAGGSGVINYIANADFEATANGATPANWTAYADAAATTPVDGTGGSPNAAVTFLASSTSPLRGTVSAVFTKDANNRQGTGWSYPFTIASPDKGYKAQVMFELDSSANYVAGDMGLYVYDVTNSVLITPSTAAIPKLTTGKFGPTFDLTSGTSYRLILHIASTSALAYTMKLDSFILNANPLGQGAAIGPKNSFTPTFNNVSVTNNGSWWRRVGDDAEIYFDVSATGASTGVIFFNPSSTGIAGAGVDPIDYGLIGSRQSLGSGEYLAATNNYAIICAYGGTTNQFSFIVNGAAARLGNTAPSGDTVTTNGRISARITVPIAIWSGSGTLNLGAGANVEYASNSNATNTATDTTSFAYGPAGSNIPNGSVGTAYVRGVQFATAAGATAAYKVEVSTNGTDWLEADERFGARVAQGTNNYGILVIVTSPTTAQVEFAIGGVQPNNTTYAGNSTTAWSAFAGFKWRLVRYNPSALVGFGQSTPTESGLVKGYVPSQRNRVFSTSSSYAILDLDGYETILLTTGASTLTSTLPNPANNAGRRLMIKKVDAGAGTVTVTRFASETIEGASSNIILANRFNHITLICDGTNWIIESVFESTFLNSTNFTFGNVSGQPASGVLRFSRSGSIVTIALNFSSVTAAGTGPITINYGAVPALARYLPTVQQFVAGGYGAGSPTGYPSSISVSTAGVLSIYKDNTANFTAGNTLTSPTNYLTLSFLVD